MKCNFYIGKDGALYKKKIRVDKYSPPYCDEVFFDKFIQKDSGDTIIQIPLDSVIDIDSYVCFDSSCYSKDKNKCYYYFDDSDGGFLSVIDTADVATFKKLRAYNWAIDKNFVYYYGNIIPGLHVKKIQLLTGVPDPQYIKDDVHVFYEYDSIPGADPGTFKLTRKKGFDAEDKNHKYAYGKAIR